MSPSLWNYLFSAQLKAVTPQMIDLTLLVVKIANPTTGETPFLISQIERYIKERSGERGWRCEGEAAAVRDGGPCKFPGRNSSGK